MEGKKQTRSTNAQLKKLTEYMSHNAAFANGEYTGPLGSRKMEAQWRDLKDLLKELGPDKSIEQWKQTWRDLKRKARHSNAEAPDAHVITGNPDQPVPVKSDMTNNIFSTIDHECSTGISPDESGIGRRIPMAKAAPEPLLEFVLAEGSEEPAAGNSAIAVDAVLPVTSAFSRARKTRQQQDTVPPQAFLDMQREQINVLKKLCDLMAESNNIKKDQNRLQKKQRSMEYLDLHPLKDMKREQTIRLIQRYGEHRLLWDDKHPHYLSAKERKESWMSIASECKLPVRDLKTKMALLLSAHRQEFNREKRSLIRAAATGFKHTYSSKWFGYPHFAFMRRHRSKQIKACHTKPSDDCQEFLEIAIEDTDASLRESQQPQTIDEHDMTQTTCNYNNIKQGSPEAIKEESESECEEEQANTSLARSLKFLQNALKLKNDPYISFGNYISSELRKYDQHTLACVKRSIHSVILKADLGIIQVPSDDLTYQPSESSSTS